MKKYNKILLTSLGMAGIVLLIISSGVRREPERHLLLYIGLTLLLALVIQGILFTLKPGAFKNKPGNPDRWERPGDQ